MKPRRTFISIPSLPPALEPIRKIAYNLHWAWDHDAIELFRRLDSELWEQSGHNPVLMLGKIDQQQLETLAQDDGFMSYLDRVSRDLDAYLGKGKNWYSNLTKPDPLARVAYFSAEFGITECLSIFAGGLGVLAGDHLKSASDLGLPLVGVGLLYQQGYFQQYLNEAGWQQERYTDNDFHNLPITLARQPDGAPVIVKTPFPGRTVSSQVWQAQIGRVTLYLLDTNLPANQPQDREITDQLYGGDQEMRIQQEIVLGIGGYQALADMGIQSTIYHMNEGHSAFLSLERVRALMKAHNLNFYEARQAASSGLVFTTHTPVSAGQDYFPPALIDRYLSYYWNDFGISRRDFLALGRQDPNNEKEAFCMTVLALKMAAYSNGVSQLHGKVSRNMWLGLWKDVPEDEIPIRHVTNGVHLRTWVSRDMAQLYDRYLGYRWLDEPADPVAWQRVEQIPPSELWRTHERRRERLVAFARRRLRDQLIQRGAYPAAIQVANEVLDPEALTIGFARRFATYKRATLLFRDAERLAKILNHPQRPVQLIIAGKAHPQDQPGKELIQKIIQFTKEDTFRRRVVFLEDYDVNVARYLVQGSDVWLNTPLRLLEASGTSGMKAAVNGGLNVSTLDGWWDEAYQPNAGWAIGRGENYQDLEYQAQVEAEALYELLEQDIVPAFYHRGEDKIPYRWIARMKASIRELGNRFNTHRMVIEYTTKFYQPASACYQTMIADDFARARALAAWMNRLQQNWPQVWVEVVDLEYKGEIEVGEKFNAYARVSLGQLSPQDVRVELFLGTVNAEGEIIHPRIIPMQLFKMEKEGVYLFIASSVDCAESGLRGYTVRVLPDHPDLTTPFLPGIISWATE